MRRFLPTVAVAGAAVLFGSTFTIIKSAVDSLPPATFVMWRFLIATLVLAAVRRPRTKAVWRDGLIAGGFLFIGFATQTQGLLTTTASNSALITGLYVIFVPLLVALERRSLPRPATVIGAVVGVGGLALLTNSTVAAFVAGGTATGDGLTLVAAAAFASHIVAISRSATRHNLIEFTAVQMGAVSFMAAIWAMSTTGLVIPGASDILALVVTGLIVSVGAFLLQVWGQMHMVAARAGIILSIEPVVGAMLAAVILGETLTTRGWAGAALIVASIYLVMWSTTDEMVALEAISSSS